MSKEFWEDCDVCHNDIYDSYVSGSINNCPNCNDELFTCDGCGEIGFYAGLALNDCKYCDMYICEHCWVKGIGYIEINCCDNNICEVCGENKMIYDDKNDKIYCRECYPNYTIEEIRCFTQEYPINDLLADRKIQYCYKTIISYLRIEKKKCSKK